MMECNHVWKVYGNYVFTSDPPLYPVICEKCKATSKMTMNAIARENAISTEERVMVLTKDEYDIFLNLVIDELDNRHVIYLPDWEELPYSTDKDWKPRCFDKSVCNGNRTEGSCATCRFRGQLRVVDKVKKDLNDLEELDGWIEKSLTVSDEAMNRKVDL